MIDGYEIKNINGEERLILYFNYNYEFGKIGNGKGKNKSIKDTIKDYLIKNKIDYKGSIIGIVIGGVLIGNLILNRPVVNNSYEYKPDIIEVDKLLYVPNIEIEEGEKIVEEMPSNEENTSSEVNISNSSTTNKSATTKKSNSKISSNSNNNVTNNTSTNSHTNSNSNSSVNTNTNPNSNTTNNSNTIIKEEVVDNNIYVNLKRRNGNVEKVELEEYVTGVVSAEMPALFASNALKAQAIIARTYALKAISNGKTLTDTESTQSYKDVNALKSLWGSNFNTYYNKIKTCVNETKGMYLTYNGTYIEAVYHSTSNGRTENSSNVWGNYYPYLISVDSPYDTINPSFISEKEISYSELSNKLGMDINHDTEFLIIDYTEGNRVKNISVNNKMYSGVEFRNLLGLRSADFSIEKLDNGIKVTTKGYGHGVGLSQYGANGMAKNGTSYVDILKHFYRGVTISKK